MDKTSKFNYHNATLSLIMAVCAFICFIVFYLCYIFLTINPNYLLGLLCLLPTIIFLLIAFYKGKSRKPRFFVNIITIILIPILALSSLLFILVIIDDAYPVTDSKKYERVLNFGDNKNKEIFAIFPKKIPNDAYNVKFYYNEEGFQDYLIEARLTFNASISTIEDLKYLCEERIIDSSYDIPSFIDIIGDDKKNINDYETYLIINNYFDISVVLISKSTNEIIFYACTFSL